MIYDGNFRIEETSADLIPVDCSPVELIARNDEKQLSKPQGWRIQPFAIQFLTANGCKRSALPMLSLPMQESFYVITNPLAHVGSQGGFVYDGGVLLFAKGMINLRNDRDSYRQQPNIMQGNYFTDASFSEFVLSFKAQDVPLFRTIDDTVFYDKRINWPNHCAPRVDGMEYETALQVLENK